MSETIKNIENMNLSGTKDGNISISVIEEPYGLGSNSVVSIGISLQKNSEEPDWKVHIPKGNIEDVIKALQEASKGL